MQQGQVRWHLGREGVVVREDHLNAQLLGPLQGFFGRNSVVHSDQQPDPLGRKPVHHGGIQSIALLHAAGNGCNRLGP